MMELLFEGWPNGVGPTIVQIFLAMVGAAAGIRLVDDLKRVRASTRARRVSR